jgi:tRNA(fMet)-specific endonuclease VapC
MKYMLDTNVCIAIIKECPEEVKEKLSKIPVGEIGISSIVVAELWYGIRLSHMRKHNEVALNEFLKYVIVLDWPEEAAPEYGRIRAHLKKKGTPIGANDLLIAAHALALDAVLVTDNIREFRRTPNLKIENWISR